MIVLCVGTVEAAAPDASVTVADAEKRLRPRGMFFTTTSLVGPLDQVGRFSKTTDGGHKWKKVSSGTSSLLTAVLTFVTRKRGWVVGANGTVQNQQGWW